VTRYLVLANQTLGDQGLLDRLSDLARSDASSLYLMVPATRLSDQEHALSRSEHVPFWPGEAQEVTLARTRLKAALEGLRERGIHAEGEVGDPDPMRSIQEALQLWEVDEIVVSTLPRSTSRWLRQDLLRQAERRFGLPVSHIEKAEGVGPPRDVAPAARESQ
jgi:GABA permease